MGVTPYRRIKSLAAKHVCLGPVKRATCTDFVLVKSRNTRYFELVFASTLQNKLDLDRQTNNSVNKFSSFSQRLL